ncbi:MAG TPA: hypothetical protein VGB37_01120 [Candidatus Lokiarchaeia archaeon]
MFYFITHTETTKELLRIVENLNFKGYEFLKNSGSCWSGDKRILNKDINFFIWKKKGKSEYIRITLLSNRYPRSKEELLFYWNLEPSFKPFRYKHNHRAGSNIKSNFFKPNDDETYIKEFKELRYE